MKPAQFGIGVLLELKIAVPLELEMVVLLASPELELGSAAMLLLELDTIASPELELGSAAMLLLELETIGSLWLSEPEHAKSVKAIAAKEKIFLVIVLPRNMLQNALWSFAPKQVFRLRLSPSR